MYKTGFEAVSFPGHKLGMGSVAVKDNILLKRIQAGEITKSKKQVQVFLGPTGHYREFIPQYADIAHLLVQLTKKRALNTVK